MGWFVGPINGIPAIHHQGETFNFHANAVLVPGSRTGVIVLMNAENSIDLFLTGRMGTISEGVTSLLEGRDPAPAAVGIATFVVYTVLFGIVRSPAAQASCAGSRLCVVGACLAVASARGCASRSRWR